MGISFISYCRSLLSSVLITEVSNCNTPNRKIAMSKKTTKILDFNKLEDQFFCIDVLTRAKFEIQSSSTELAAEIDIILESLTEISKNPPKNLPPEPPKETASTPTEDLEVTRQFKVEESTDDDNDDIIDLLTGDKIS